MKKTLTDAVLKKRWCSERLFINKMVRGNLHVCTDFIIQRNISELLVMSNWARVSNDVLHHVNMTQNVLQSWLVLLSECFVSFIKQHLSTGDPDSRHSEVLRVELEELQQKYDLLQEENRELRNRVRNIPSSYIYTYIIGHIVQ